MTKFGHRLQIVLMMTSGLVVSSHYNISTIIYTARYLQPEGKAQSWCGRSQQLIIKCTKTKVQNVQHEKHMCASGVCVCVRVCVRVCVCVCLGLLR